MTIDDKSIEEVARVHREVTTTQDEINRGNADISKGIIEALKETNESLRVVMEFNVALAGLVKGIHKTVGLVFASIFLVFLYAARIQIATLMSAIQSSWEKTGRDMKLVIVAGVFTIIAVFVAQPAQYFWKKLLKK